MARKQPETRDYRGTVELRDGANGPMIAGYMAVYNRPSADMGFVESIDPGAFTKTLQEADVRGIGNHNTDWLLGRVKSGTMRVGSDSVGVWYELDVNRSDPDGQRALAKVQRGDWDGASFTFATIRDEWNWEATPPERRLLEVSLIEGGPCTFPAYPDATATARALAPIAEKVNRPVEELVSALNTGEIRSLVSPTKDVTEDAEEERAGKAFSSANQATITEHLDAIRDLVAPAESNAADDDGVDDALLDVAQTEAPADSEIGPFRSLAHELELRQRVAALDAA